MPEHHFFDEAVDAKIDALKKRDLDVRSSIWGKHLTVPQQNTLVMERKALEAAEIYVWTPHMVNLMIEAAKDYPPTVKLDPTMIRSMAGWWWLGRDSKIMVRSYISVPDMAHREGYAERRNLHAVLFSDTVDGLYISGFTYDHFEPSGLIVPVSSTIWPYGQTLGDHLHEIHSIQSKNRARDWPQTAGQEEQNAWSYTTMKVSTLFMVGSTLMNQKLLRLTEGRISRGVRRRAERLNRDLIHRTRVIALRRPEYLRERTESQRRDWDIQWAVSGHWRNQEHIEAGRPPIRVTAHVKGNPDAPLLHSERLFVVKD